jgi:ABC-2 type transport system permease protein
MIAKTFRVLWMLFKMKLAKTMVFRFNFFGVFFVDGSLFLMQLLMFSSIYEQVGSIGGWQRGEMLIFIGTFSIINALNMHLFFFGIISIPGKIRSGELDFYIVKPISSLLHLSFEHIDIGSIPLVIASIGLVIYGVIVDSITVSVLTVVGYSFMVLCMGVLWYDIMVIIRTIPFFVINASSLENFEGSS